MVSESGLCGLADADCRTDRGPLMENGLTAGDGAAEFLHLGRGREFLRLRLDSEPKQGFGRVFPDKPDLLVTHVPELVGLCHD